MKKKIEPAELTPSEREEMIRLKARIEYLEAENAVIKKRYTSFEVFSRAISDYIDYYNNRRIQAKTKWMPPVKFRKASMR